MKYTINVQTIYDCNGRFTDFDINWPGSLHDAVDFCNFKIQKGYAEGKLNPLSANAKKWSNTLKKQFVGFCEEYFGCI